MSLEENEKKEDSQYIPYEGISSKTVVKYVEPKLLTSNSYNKLAEKTNLNLPPPNWLKEFLPGSFTPSQINKNDSFDLSSLLMAGRYPDMFIEVDVVSASKQIKKLLMTPFNKNSSYSMSVHRIGKSLILNDLDIPLFLKSKQIENNKDLQWLYDLYCAADNQTEGVEIHPKKKNKEVSQLQMIESKFMYYSIEGSSSTENEKTTRSGSLCEVFDEKPVSSNTAVEQKPLFDGFPQGSYFLRDVLWTFEDITMLVGSDLPIFGGGKYPAVSLRLRDASKPINVLTGIDYWLDNLMCNVPELMMCYHLKGIVQKYEKIKTADLPFMENNQFSPKIVKDVAQNILSFLKSNCTKEGHTYWLFKSNKEDVIKLYDLTSISAKHGSKDPFSLSVALLLYKIAYNMYTTSVRNDPNILKMVALLENCIKLLKFEECNEVLVMSNYLLSNLYSQSLVTSTSKIDPSILQEDDFDNDSSYASEDESEVDPLFSSIDVKTLCEDISEKRKCKKFDYVNNNLDEEQKCKNAIKATIEVLKIILHKCDIKKLTATENDSLQMIPLNTNLDESLLTLPVEKDGGIIVTPFTTEGMKSKLLHQAAKCYLSLIRISLSKDKFGRALRFLKIIFQCLMESNQKFLSAQALLYFGDTMTMLASRRDINIDSEKIDFLQLNTNDRNLLDLLCDGPLSQLFDVDVSDIGQCFSYNFEELLTKALAVYEESLSNIKNESEQEMVQLVIDLTKRLGNIRNELGVFFLNKSYAEAKNFGMPTDNEMSLWKFSYNHFDKGIKAFEFINDKINMALLYSNTGKLMRLCAQVYGNSTKVSMEKQRGQFTQQEETYFKKAFEFYNKGLSLVQGETCLDIKNSLLLELSGAYFAMASTIQDNAPLHQMAEEKVVKQISSAFVKSLNFLESSEVETSATSKQIGEIHQKLASLYHHLLRNQISDHGKKNFRSLAELHYNKVYNAIQPEYFPMKTLQVIMEHLALYDYLLSQGNSPKSLKNKQDLLFSSKNGIRKALGELSSRAHNKTLEEREGLVKLLQWLYNQLTSTMKETIKYLNGKHYKNIFAVDITTSKKMFEKIIRERLPDSLHETLICLRDLLEVLRSLFEKNL